MSQTRLRQRDPGWQDQVLDRARAAAKLEAAAGFPKGAEGIGIPHYENGASILQVAIWNNYGFGVPRRPFMFVASKKIHEATREAITRTIQQINRGATDGRKALERMAILAQGIIQTTITDGNWKPNEPGTIRAKGSSQPLIDSGDMRKYVAYEVREKA